jgi:hypothetical protein
MCFLIAKLYGRGFPEQNCALAGPLDAQKESISGAGASHADKRKALQREVLRGEIEEALSGGLYFLVFC